MARLKEPPAADDGEAHITLGVLTAVEGNSRLTQRSLASHLGIALGLTNAYLKRCIHKGWVKVNHAPANRYAYYLTPRGFAEKSRLTADYLSSSFHFFRGARSQCVNLLAECDRRGWRRLILAGVSDLAEIAVLCTHEHQSEVIGIVDPAAGKPAFAGVRVAPRLDDLGAFDAVIVTDFRDPQAAYDRLAESVIAERILTPPLLNISREPPELAE